MGCGGSSPIDNTDTVEKRLKLGLENVKTNLHDQLEDSRMMEEVIKVLFVYLKTATNTEGFQPFFIDSFVGIYLLSDKRFPQQVGTAIHKCVRPEQLRNRNLTTNMLSFTHVFKELEKSRAKVAGDGLADRQLNSSELIEALGGSGIPVAPEHVTFVEQNTVTYNDHKQLMLGTLEPLCELVEAILSVDNLKESFCTFAGKGPNWLDDLQRNFGVVTAVVKVFEPSQVSVDLKIPAFVGPESYGKSTLINHIVSKGRNVEFMPASPGMGTQVVCKISKGLHESFQMASDSGPQSGSVKDRLAKVNEEMTKKQQKGMLGIKDMDILRAEKNFVSPVPMEFLDVPGIKPSTAFHTSLALGLATTVVLVCGSPQSLASQLENGDLALLTNIVRDLEAPIPIQAAVSYRVTAAEFGKSKAMYVQILTRFFPTCEIKEPLWMNFFAMSDLADKERTVEQFLEQAATGSTKVVDPYARFFKLQDEVEEFTKTFHKFLRHELKYYFQGKMPKSSTTGTGAMKEVWENLVKMQTDTNSAKQLLSDQMSGNRISETLDRVVLEGELDKFVVNVSGRPFSEVENVVLIAQGLLTECRLCEMDWLIKQAKELHQSGFGDIFKPVCQKINAANVVPIFNLRVSEAYAMFGTQLAEDADEKHEKYIVNAETHQEKLNMRWWTKECCSKVAPYLEPTAFAWFLTGFYLVSGDSKNKHDLLKLLRKPKTTVSADQCRQRMLDSLSAIPYGTWVKEVNAAEGDQTKMFRALFDSMEKACKQFGEIAKESRTLTGANNFAMSELLELVFVMTERIFTKQFWLEHMAEEKYAEAREKNKIYSPF